MKRGSASENPWALAHVRFMIVLNGVRHTPADPHPGSVPRRDRRSQRRDRPAREGMEATAETETQEAITKLPMPFDWKALRMERQQALIIFLRVELKSGLTLMQSALLAKDDDSPRALHKR